MPSLSEAAKYLRHGRTEADFNKGSDIIGKLEKVLNENIYINRHLQDKSVESGPISYNVIPLIDSYARSVSRFNYVAYNTSKYIDFVLTRLTTVGAIYLTMVALMPEFLISKTSIPFYLGGTSLLIVVVVMIDFITQIQSHLFQHQYEGLLKKTKLKGRR